MALSLSGTSNGSLNNLSLTSNTGTILDSANTTFFGVDMWRLTTTLNAPIPDSTVITNLERVDDASYGKVGTGMTESSGVFTFPSTGIYLVLSHIEFQITSVDTQCHVYTAVTQDNSSYTKIARAVAADGGSQANQWGVSQFTLVDVTDVSQVKVRFEVTSMTVATRAIMGSSTDSRTNFCFMRVGDT